MMDKPYVTVVTPVHNGESYISEAIESVLSQTYPFDEYIIVENCSTDRTPEIARSYAKRDARIRIVYNERLLPAIDNHNLAMRQISDSSKYCKVLHADDLLFPHCLEAMLDLAERYPGTGIISSYTLKNRRVSNQGIPFPKHILSGQEVCRRTLLEGGFYVFGNPSCLLLRSDLVRARSPFYNPHMLGDVEACFDVLRESDFGFVHQVLTISRVHPETISSAHEWRGKNVLGMLTVLLHYGPQYLNADEYQQNLRKRLNTYYRFLGRNLLQRRGKGFWEYQHEWLASMGLKLDRGRVITSALKVIVENITRPGQWRAIISGRTVQERDWD